MVTTMVTMVLCDGGAIVQPSDGRPTWYCSYCGGHERGSRGKGASEVVWCTATTKSSFARDSIRDSAHSSSESSSSSSSTSTSTSNSSNSSCNSSGSSSADLFVSQPVLIPFSQSKPRSIGK
uniref:Uncharacterized protein n=1 Tax=Vespula pensylvanica TaxID=30213 RepID=A0A834UG15_VESPE|nr:hypothetical protein H0235_000245 [Vespula pensylvanica]